MILADGGFWLALGNLSTDQRDFAGYRWKNTSRSPICCCRTADRGWLISRSSRLEDHGAPSPSALRMRTGPGSTAGTGASASGALMTRVQGARICTNCP